MPKFSCGEENLSYWESRPYVYIKVGNQVHKYAIFAAYEAPGRLGLTHEQASMTIATSLSVFLKPYAEQIKSLILRK